MTLLDTEFNYLKIKEIESAISTQGKSSKKTTLMREITYLISCSFSRGDKQSVW